MFASWRKDVATSAYVFSLAGKLENEIKLPGLGTAGGFGGLSDDKYVFYNFTSFNFPSTIYKYDIATKQSTVFRTVDIPSFKPEQYETKQVFFNSKDGTRVPMFLVYKKGIKLDGNNPTLLYGYGGFNIVTAPNFSATRLALLEQGVIYASCNMRGGGEYGEKWHEAGTKLKKQNVFDDFIAAAEYLISQKYTSPNRLAIQGGSNGGLLVVRFQISVRTCSKPWSNKRRDGHAALPQVHHWLELDCRLRFWQKQTRLSFKRSMRTPDS